MKDLKKRALVGLLVLVSLTIMACGTNNGNKEGAKNKDNHTVKKFKGKGYLFSDRSYPSFSNMIYSLVLDNPDTGITFESYVKLEKKGDNLIPSSIASIRYNEKDKDIDSEMVYFEGKHSADEEDTLDAYTNALKKLGLSQGDFIDFVLQYAKDNYKTSEEDLEDAKKMDSDTEETTDDEEDSDDIATKKPDFGSLSDSWDSFQIELDGDVVQLPLKYKEFETFGWSAKESNSAKITDTIKAGDYESTFYMVKGDAEVSVRVKNFSEKDQKLKDCDITEILISTSQIAKLGRGATLPGGIKVAGDNNSILMDTIKNKYDDSRGRVVDVTNSLIYEVSASKNYTFRFSDYYDDELYEIKIAVDAKR
ncbi:hypothetical protein [Candidatus Enterococcus ikei]|uniref:DUF5067 domain-containing protein n=1 Tax=Candidatus Enterococcus ikei TaxID=2815326 RepID=A0ABS3GUU5_9ENTE|nr:hypothetical protein [Enterococcus sp. DIV0869a]MBO0439032.1 hypothetical protein [Enterococcus sp. DIV0869a]